MKKALIMDIQRYSIHDGPGIRTTVFFKGCHMACKWCHNPESQHPQRELLFYGRNCIKCMSCFLICGRSAHRMENGEHKMDLSLCLGCSRMEECSLSCPAQALRLCGQEMDAETLLKEVERDKDFYGLDGGVTCSGGEPLLQDDFLLEFLPLCKEKGISTCLDTTLNVERKKVERLLPFVDLFLADIKFMDGKNHRVYTGTDGKWTVENLHFLSRVGKPVILRMPLIANINDTKKETELRKELLKSLSNVRRIDFFAVTNHGAAKYGALQRKQVLFNEDVDLQSLAKKMQKNMMNDQE